TGEWLQDKGLLLIADESFRLTEKGRHLATRLLDKAIEHEQQAMSCLNAEQQQMLKDSLGALQKGFVG
ncbi:MAG: hypothetical protein GYB41_12685, partial [Oceanospirillales bacterium]|nr:hypothetical protein [Oceanospirillales bacterium]